MFLGVWLKTKNVLVWIGGLYGRDQKHTYTGTDLLRGKHTLSLGGEVQARGGVSIMIV